jgi:hypothetical protein
MADDNPFDPAALLAWIEFRMSDEQWAVIARFAAARGFDAAKIGILARGKRAAVSLREEIDNALREYLARCKFRERHPSATRRQVERSLEAHHNRLRDARLALRRDPIALTFGPESSAAQAAIEAYENETKKYISAYQRGESPGLAAPSDGEIVKDSQRVHREFAQDPDERLIQHLRDIFARAFGKPGSSNAGLTAEFITIAARPVRELGNIRRMLEKLRTVPSRYPQPRLEIRSGHDRITVHPPRNQKLRRRTRQD